MPLWQAVWGSDIHKLSGKIFKASEVSDITDTPTGKGSFMRLPCQKLQLGYLYPASSCTLRKFTTMKLDIRAASGFDFAHRRHRVHDLIKGSLR